MLALLVVQLLLLLTVRRSLADTIAQARVLAAGLIVKRKETKIEKTEIKRNLMPKILLQMIYLEL